MKLHELKVVSVLPAITISQLVVQIDSACRWYREKMSFARFGFVFHDLLMIIHRFYCLSLD